MALSAKIDAIKAQLDTYIKNHNVNNDAVVQISVGDLKTLIDECYKNNNILVQPNIKTQTTTQNYIDEPTEYINRIIG